MEAWIFKPNFHSSHPQPFPFLKGGEVNFDYLPHSGGIWKIKKRRWKSGAGASVHIRVGEEGEYFSNLIFSRFVIFIFRNYFKLCKTVSWIWRKIIFFCHHNFMKKSYSRLSKNEPEHIPSIEIAWYIRKGI